MFWLNLAELGCFRLAIPPHSSDVWRTPEMVVTYNSCSSHNVAVELSAVSPGQFFFSVLSYHRFWRHCHCCCLHSKTILSAVFHGISNALEILLYPSPDWYLSTVGSLWCCGGSLRTVAFENVRKIFQEGLNFIWRGGGRSHFQWWQICAEDWGVFLKMWLVHPEHRPRPQLWNTIMRHYFSFSFLLFLLEDFIFKFRCSSYRSH